MAMNIINSKVTETNGLLSKIEIGGKVYEIKDLIARQNVESLSGALDQVAADLAALAYVKATGVYADDAAIKGAIDAAAKTAKDYTDAQVGAINKFDVHVMQPAEELPTAAAETMYVLYLKPNEDAASGSYVEYITVRSGEEGAYTYTWEAIGSTKMDVTGFVTAEALAEELKKYHTVAEAHEEHEAIQKAISDGDNAIIETLGDLAHKDSATGTVAGQTVSGVKATGTSTGSITVELQQSEHDMASAGKFTPAGTVSGTVETAGSINVTVSHEGAEATLSKGDYTPAGTISADFGYSSVDATPVMGKHTPAGDVSVTLSGNTFNAITGVGTQASFTEGAFTPATLTKEDVTANYATEGIVGTVNDDECLVFTAAGIAAITASKVNDFTGGSKAADQFVANSLPTMKEQNVGVQSATFTGTEHDAVVGVKYDKAALNSLTFAGTKVEGALVTGVTYDKAKIGSATFTGATVDITASFEGQEGDVSVSGKCHDYAVKTAEFNGAAIELAVGDIAIAAKEVTVQ